MENQLVGGKKYVNSFLGEIEVELSLTQVSDGKSKKEITVRIPQQNFEGKINPKRGANNEQSLASSIESVLIRFLPFGDSKKLSWALARKFTPD
ncbi:MAG TPA: hypothetical protein PKH06_01810 [Candidatus Dojkabacteria bacterium]|nr:hypothetical protein [Candidatus Dojkabacteria bacterium]